MIEVSPNNVSCIWDAGATLGEGPVWVEREQALYWMDIKGGYIHRIDPATGARQSWIPDHQPASLVPAVNGDFVGAFRNGFAKVAFPKDELRVEAIADPEQDLPGNRFNDGKVDNQGRFWAGTMDDNATDPTAPCTVLTRI